MTHRYHPCHGGSETYGREIVRRFVDRGNEVDVYTSDADDLWYFTNPRRKFLRSPRTEFLEGARIHRLPVRHFPGQRYVGRLLSYFPHWPTRCCWESYMPVIPDLFRIDQQYDVVFGLGFPFTVFSYAAYKIAKASNAPLILTPFLHLSTPGDVVHRNYTRPHQVRLLKESDLVVVQTDLEAEVVRDWGIPRDAVRRLGMGVCRDQVTGGDRMILRNRLGISQSTSVIGYLGVSDLNKGTVDLVRAVERLNAKRAVQSLIHLILGGGASPDFERFLETLGPSVPRWLHRLGPVPQESVRDFYAALDVFAMPSRTDSFGIVFLEAWANGLPVVAAAAGGVTEVVEHDVTGLLVPFGDVERLAQALGTLIEDPSTAVRLGTTGQERVSRNHDWDDRFESLNRWVRELIARGRDSAGRHPKSVWSRAHRVK